MESQKLFRVAVVGDLTEREWQILATATRLTTARPRSYIFERPGNSAPDIYLVEGDHPEMLSRWNAVRVKHSAPAVMLLADPTGSSGKREFRRPIVPSCLLSLVTMLDEVTVQELNFLPELSIGNEAAHNPSAVIVKNKNMHSTALVVDDSSTVQAQVGLGLRMFGVAADFADSAEEAYELLERNSYDIAFLDVILPGGADGYQICKTIKKNQRSKHTSVIMLTSKSSTFDRVRASLAGCDDFLTKPVENAVFQRTLYKYLSDKNGTTASQAAPAK